MKGVLSNEICDYLLVILSAVLYVFVIYNQFEFLGWLTYIPVFYVLLKSHVMNSFVTRVFVFGFTLSSVINYWMINAMHSYQGGSIIMPLLVYILLAFIIGGIYALIVFLVQLIIQKFELKLLWVKALGIVLAFLTYEVIMQQLGKGMPFFIFYSSYSILQHSFVIQWMSVINLIAISGIYLVISMLIAYGIVVNRWYCVAGFFIIMGVFYGGYTIRENFEKEQNVIDKVRVGVVCENQNPSIKWNENNADALVKHLLSVYRQTLNLNPDVVLWSESAIPWTYTEEDDFVNEVLSMAKDDAVYQVMGINTYVDSVSIYNSAYLFAPNGSLQNRYDKRYLLDFTERPLWNITLPIQGISQQWVKEGHSNNIFRINKYKAGILICNETNIQSRDRALKNKNIDYLLALSNDGWFNGNDLVLNIHVLQAQLRAIATRRDIVINNNWGYTGIVRASGFREVIYSKQPLSLVFDVNIYGKK